MKKIFAWILCLLVLSGMAGCSSEEQAAPELLEPVGVKTSTALVQRETIYTLNTFDGELVPYVEELHFLSDGKLGEIFVLPGDSVEEGQVLATLDAEAINKEIAALDDDIYEISTLGKYSDRQAAANIGIAKTELEKMRAEGASQQKCTEKGLEIQKLELSLRQAQELRNMELSAKYSAMNALKESLKTNQIVAPFDGRIVYVRNIKSGTSVKGYSTVICIADETSLTLQIDFQPERTFAIADKFYAQIQGKAYDITYAPYDQTEYLSLLLSGKQVKTQFSIDAEPGELESGLFAVVMVLYNYKEDVLTIPVNALYRDQNGRHVYKLVDGQRVRCDVTVGHITETKLEILEGLEEGDVVCVND